MTETKTGKIVLKKGKARVFKNGKIPVYNSDGNCFPCCDCCKPKILAGFVTNASDPNRRTWDLTPYQGDGIDTDYKKCPHAKWMLRDYPSGTIYNMGDMDENGRLVSLPDSFTSRYNYDGNMKILLGCKDRKTGQIKYP